MKIFDKKQKRFYKCNSCGSSDFYLKCYYKDGEEMTNILGAYCCDCRKWLKWISKKDVNLNKKEYNLLLNGGSVR